MRLNRDNALTMGLLTLFVVVSFMVYLSARTVDPVRDHSTYRHNAAGTRAFYTLLQRVNVSVARHRRSLAEVPRDAASYWIISPTVPLDGGDYRRLKDWVREGHVLVIASSLGAQPESLDTGLGAPEGLGLARDMKEEFGLEVSPKGAPNVLLEPEPSSPLALMVKQVQLTSRARLSSDNGGRTVHLRDDDGAVVVSLSLGRGVVFVLSDPEILSNAKLLDADNVAFCYNLVRWQVPSGVVYFDEYHHGFTDAPTLGAAMRRSAVGWGICQAVLAVVVLVLGRTPRFGSPIPAFTRRRRSALEYVRSLASLYRAAGARPAVLEMLYLEFRRQATAQFGARPGMTNADLGALIAARRGGYPAQVAATLNAVAAGARVAQVAEEELLRLGREIARYEGRRAGARE